MEKNEFSLESFKNIQELIKFTDQKTGGVLVVLGLVLTVFLGCADKLDFNHDYSSPIKIAVIISGTMTIGFVIYTVYLSIFHILRPRLADHYAQDDISLLYFHHLASMTDKTAMFDKFKALDDDAILRIISDQIFEISKILDNKIIELHNSMNFMFYSLVSLLVFISLSRFI